MALEFKRIGIKPIGFSCGLDKIKVQIEEFEVSLEEYKEILESSTNTAEIDITLSKPKKKSQN